MSACFDYLTLIHHDNLIRINYTPHSVSCHGQQLTIHTSCGTYAIVTIAESRNSSWMLARIVSAVMGSSPRSISSSISSRGLLDKNKRANAILCFSPPDILLASVRPADISSRRILTHQPSSPASVESQSTSMQANLHAAITLSSDGYLPHIMFSRTVPSKI
jgi:hypothetical protein